MASEQGHWITKDGRKIFIREDLIDKQYREIERFEKMRKELNSFNNELPKSNAYKATYDIEPDRYPGKSEQSKKYIKGVSEVIDRILKNAKRDGIEHDHLEDYIWDRLGDNYSNAPQGEDIKIVNNNGGEYDADAMIDAVDIFIHLPWDGSIRVTLVGRSYYMSEFDDDELEQMGIYKNL